jgi:PAS domain S-box-containing protein
MSESKASELAQTTRVLHVDDDLSILDISKQILMDMDSTLEIDCACSVDEAFKKLAIETYDAIISDYEMPQKTGLQFLKELREQKNDIPFFLFTGKGREEVAVTALNIGADGYYNKQGSPETVYGELMHGIKVATEKRKVKQALEEKEKRHCTLINQSTSMFIVHDIKGQIVEVNPQACKSLGYSQEELLTMNIADLSPEVADDKKGGLILPKVINGDPVTFESCMTSKDGRIFPIEATLGTIKVNKETLVFGFVRDLTERKNSELKLKNSQEHLNAIISKSPIGISTSDSNMNFLSANESFCRILGFSEEELRKLTFKDITHPDDIGESLENYAKLISDHIPFFCEEKRYIRKDGRVINGKIVVTVIKKNGCKPDFFIAELDDITEDKKTEKALAESEDKYRTIFENAPDVIVTVDLTGRITSVNNAILHHGFKIDEIMGRSIFTLFPAEYEKKLLGGLRNIADGNSVKGEIEILTPKGKIIAEYSSNPLRLNGNIVGYQTILRDVTERKKAEEACKELEGKFRSLVECTSDWIWQVDQNAVYTYVSPKIQDMLGYCPEEVLGKTPFDLMTKDEASKVSQKFWEFISRKEPFQGIYNWNVHKNGSLVLLETSGVPIVDDTGCLLGYKGIDRDVTERKKTADSLVMVNEKLRVVGKLTRHDVRNKLSAINSAAYLLKKKYGSDPEANKYLEIITSAVAMSDRLFEFSQLYEKIGAEEQTEIYVKRCFDEAVALFPNLGKVKVINGVDGLSLVADSLLRQIFYNLIDNSWKHGIKVTQIKLYYKKMGDKIKLYFEDDGVGIPMENKVKIFSEGFSTSNGTGLGLPLIKKMIEFYGWSVQEIGIQDQGVRFEITISL